MTLRGLHKKRQIEGQQVVPDQQIDTLQPGGQRVQGVGQRHSVGAGLAVRYRHLDAHQLPTV